MSSLKKTKSSIVTSPKQSSTGSASTRSMQSSSFSFSKQKIKKAPSRKNSKTLDRENTLEVKEEVAFKIWDVLTAFKSFKKPEPCEAGVFLINKTYRVRLRLWIKKVRQRLKNNEVVNLIHKGMYVGDLAKEFNIEEDKDGLTDTSDDDTDSMPDSIADDELNSSDEDLFKEINEQLKQKSQQKSKSLPNFGNAARFPKKVPLDKTQKGGGGAKKASADDSGKEFDLFQAMLGGKDKETGFSIKNMVNGMIKSVYTKEMMLPVSKTVVEQLPPWLAMNGHTITKVEKGKYEQALVIYQELLEVCEDEIDENDEKEKEKQAAEITKLCTKLQALNVKLPVDIQVNVQENTDVGAMTENIMTGMFSGLAGGAAGGKEAECSVM